VSSIRIPESGSTIPENLRQQYLSQRTSQTQISYSPSSEFLKSGLLSHYLANELANGQ
jgi:hypothetical protein